MTTSSSTAARAGTNTPSRSATTAASASASITSDVRMDQILDDEDHKHSVTSSQRTLTTLTIASLSGLQKEIQADNWKYEGQNNINRKSRPCHCDNNNDECVGAFTITTIHWMY
jgi:hypothetical protein